MSPTTSWSASSPRSHGQSASTAASARVPMTTWLKRGARESITSSSRYGSASRSGRRFILGSITGSRASPGCEGIEEATQPLPFGGQHVLEVRRTRVSYLAPKNPRGLGLAEPLRERRGRDRPERVPELGEPRASRVRRVQNRHGVAAFEDVRRSTDVLGYRLESLTP